MDTAPVAAGAPAGRDAQAPDAAKVSAEQATEPALVPPDPVKPAAKAAEPEPIAAEAAAPATPERAEGKQASPPPAILSPDTRAAFKTFSAALGRDLGSAARRMRAASSAAAARTGSHAARAGGSVAEAARRAGQASGTGFAAIRRRAHERWQASRAPAGTSPPPDETGPKPAGPPKRRLFLKGTAAAALIAMLGLGGVYAWALSDISWSTVASETVTPTVSLEASDGQRLVQQGPFRAAYTPLAGFPAHVVDAVISIEDRRFYDHPGIDPQGIFRALSRNISAGEVAEGGSTITQQLLKIMHLERDRTLKRKVQEATLALWLETQLSKDEILTRYLNNIYLGAGATGVPAAARIYFDKEVGQLTVAEAALLAGLIKAPSQLNPLVNPAEAKARAALVLDAMVQTGRLDAPKEAAADVELAALKPVAPDVLRAGGWFADWAIGEAREIAGAFPGNVSVQTTLDPQLQEIAQRVVTGMIRERGGALGASQAALVAMRPDGAVLAMVGGTDYGKSQFNRAARAMRQPGSTFKLFVYYAALKAGLSPTDRVLDAPIEIDGWTPENYSDGYYGRVTLAEAFARSLNAATVRLAEEVGIDQVQAAARELGIDAPLTDMPSLALGSSEVTLLDLTGAYASVRAGAAPIEPWGVAAFSTGEGGRPFRVGPATQPRTNLAEHHRALVGLLQLVVDRGTGRAASLDGFAAGKTGTSQNSRDAWFVGFNEDLVVGVWVGNDDSSPMRNVTGGQLPAQIWQAFMTEAGDRARPATPSGAPSAQVQPRSAPERSSAGQVAMREEVGRDEIGREEVPEDPDAAPVAGPQCNVRACARAYRSFRMSDCSYQPWRGGARRQCTN